MATVGLRESIRPETNRRVPARPDPVWGPAPGTAARRHRCGHDTRGPGKIGLPGDWPILRLGGKSSHD